MAGKASRARKRMSRGDFTIPSPAEVEAAGGPHGAGFTAKQLAEWGVTWPPKKGWKLALEVKWRAANWKVGDQREPSNPSRITGAAFVPDVPDDAPAPWC
jgi:hypothetical protein